MELLRPTYLIDPDICKANIRAMADKASESGVIFRPHFKTHQSLVIGRWFREAGISNITVSSLSAAKYFANDGWQNITVAFPVNLLETGLINELSSYVHLGLLVEHPEVALELDKRMSRPVDVYIKIDTGYQRTGLSLDEMPLIRELATQVQYSSKLKLKGLLTHAGHTYHAKNKEEIKRIYLSAAEILREVKGSLGDDGEGLILSYGDTPSCSVADKFNGLGEIRPGNFVFYDLMQLIQGSCQFSQVAGVVVCPVVAVHPNRNQVVLYGGAIHFSKDFVLIKNRMVFGQMVEFDNRGWGNPVDGAYLISLSQEHGVLEAPDHIINALHPGKSVGIIPVHACLTANVLNGYRFPDGGHADYFCG
jgi:D-serine deaminase-like pyridoxal phosphate-dependent protein